MLQTLEWSSLAQRRKNARLGMMYKITNNLVKVKCKNLVKQPTRSRRTHSQTYNRIVCKTEARLQSFFPKTIREWNGLPEEAVSAGTVDTFMKKVAALA